MGKKDITLKDYLSDTRRYADLLNGSIFQGRQIVCGEKLTDANTVQVRAEEGSPMERTNDMVMKQTKDGKLFAVWVVANQEHVDYGMPVRVMLQEALEYERQLKEKQRKNRERMKTEKQVFRNASEFLSGVQKEERLHPVITLVVYWGKEKWQGAKNLHDMVDFGEDNTLAENLKQLIPVYPLHFLNLAEQTEYDNFQTELKILFELYARRNDKKEFMQYLKSHEVCRQLDKETYQTLGVLTNSKRLMCGKYIETKERGEVNMCQAIEELIEDGRKEGNLSGRQGMLYELVRDGMLPVQTAARKMSVTEQEFLNKMKAAGYFYTKIYTKIKEKP